MLTSLLLLSLPLLVVFIFIFILLSPKSTVCTCQEIISVLQKRRNSGEVTDFHFFFAQQGRQLPYLQNAPFCLKKTVASFRCP